MVQLWCRGVLVEVLVGIEQVHRSVSSADLCKSLADAYRLATRVSIIILLGGFIVGDLHILTSRTELFRGKPELPQGSGSGNVFTIVFPLWAALLRILFPLVFP